MAENLELARFTLWRGMCIEEAFFTCFGSVLTPMVFGIFSAPWAWPKKPYLVGSAFYLAAPGRVLRLSKDFLSSSVLWSTMSNGECSCRSASTLRARLMTPSN